MRSQPLGRGGHRRAWRRLSARIAALSTARGAQRAAAHSRARDGQPDHVVVGRAGGRRREEWLAQTVKLYEKKHPNVTIKTVLQTTDGLMPAFKAAAAAKKGPDIQYFWGGIWSLDDAWAGNTKPVSDYIPTVRAQALPEREGGHVRRQGVDGAVVRAAVVPGALPQGRAREGGRGGPDDVGRSCSRPATR